MIIYLPIEEQLFLFETCRAHKKARGLILQGFGHLLQHPHSDVI
jgi:hypothetical protein